MAKKNLVGIIGIMLFGMAIFSEQLGIDNDPGWGKGRMLILGLGIVLITINILMIVSSDRLLRLKMKISDLIYQTDIKNYTVQAYIFSFLAIVIVLIIYTWFLMPAFKSPGNAYYSHLAFSFKRGYLYLPEEPSPQLLSLSDPYNYELRKQSNVDYPWDISLYNGRFYLYWGPAPSLILAVLSDETLANVADKHLVFAFVCGLFLYSAIFIIYFWLRFNRNLPSWMIGLSLLVIGLSAPTTLLLNNPRIYEAAVLGCQFFFVGGCFWAFASITGSRSSSLWKLAIAGLHWAFALGTRIIILPAIAFLIMITLIYIWRETKTVRVKMLLFSLFAVGIPLLVSIIGLGWYNWIRFGSVSEVGVRYMLALVDYNKFTKLFSADYLYKNFLDYFVLPFQLRAEFPFIIAMENVASNNKMAGLLYTSPYFLIALIPVVRILSAKNFGKNRIPHPSTPEGWLVAALAGSALILVILILLYFFSAMNYAMDFMPSFYLLAIYQLGRGYDLARTTGNRGSVYVLLTSLLAVFSIIVSILIALPGI